MKKIVSPPAEWKCGILISDIHKNGEPHLEDFELTLDGAVEYWGQDYAPSGPLFVSVTASWASGDIVVRADIEGRFGVPCYRCLEDTGIAIKGDMRYIFTLRHPEENDEKGNRSGDEDDGEPDGSVDAIRIEPFKAEIDMSPYIWETLILNLPERVLCGEDCLGLCPVCGANRNTNDCGCAEDETDPRLDVLKDFLQ